MANTLVESGDPALLPIFVKLLKVPDERGRALAGQMKRFLDTETAAKVRVEIRKSLSDLYVRVRIEVVCRLDETKDPECARTMLALLKDGCPDEFQHLRLFQAMHRLTGSYFGYYHGSNGWKPTIAGNQRARPKFHYWIEQKAPRREA